MRGSVESLSYWDVIVQLCTVCGAVPTIVNRDILIRPTRALYSDARAQMNPVGWQPVAHTPFYPDKPRTLTNAAGQHEDFSIRKIMYGSGVQKISWKKKFNGNGRPKTIRVVADNSSNGQRGILTTQ